MRVQEFRRKVKVGATIIADNNEFDILEVVMFRLDDKSFYIKCFLSDGYVLADDADDNSFVLVREVDCDIVQPFPEELKYNDKDFTFLFEAHAVAEHTSGEEIFKEGESETFWGYDSDDGSYLSLGVNDQSGERLTELLGTQTRRYWHSSEYLYQDLLSNAPTLGRKHRRELRRRLALAHWQIARIAIGERIWGEALLQTAQACRASPSAMPSIVARKLLRRGAR